VGSDHRGSKVPADCRTLQSLQTSDEGPRETMIYPPKEWYRLHFNLRSVAVGARHGDIEGYRGSSTGELDMGLEECVSTCIDNDNNKLGEFE